MLRIIANPHRSLPNATTLSFLFFHPRYASTLAYPEFSFPDTISDSTPNTLTKPESIDNSVNIPYTQRIKRFTRTLSPINIPTSPEFGTNQHITIDEATKERLRNVLFSFHAPIRYAVAYGNGVFSQKGHNNAQSKPTIDFIFGVTHPHHWHSLNLHQNSHHYSFLRLLGSRVVTLAQERVGAGVYYNPYIELDDVIIRYGVVSIDRLCKDLLDWETLYVAGRMHTPIKILRDDSRVRLAQQVNLTSALRVALLSLPYEFREEELYRRIVGILSDGGFQGRAGDNPTTTYNAVAAQIDHFRRLYSGLIKDLPNIDFVREGYLQQDENPRFRGLMVQKLPRLLYTKVKAEHQRWASGRVHMPSDNYMLNQQIASSPALANYISTGLQSTIQGPAITQSVKGIVTAGFKKTTWYAREKFGKLWAAQ